MEALKLKQTHGRRTDPDTAVETKITPCQTRYRDFIGEEVFRFIVATYNDGSWFSTGILHSSPTAVHWSGLCDFRHF